MTEQSSWIWNTPNAHFIRHFPDEPIGYFSPDALKSKMSIFQSGFDGILSYAVKANPHPDVLRCLTQNGVSVFDVASPAEIEMVRRIAPTAKLNYHNPVRSVQEIAKAKLQGIASWSVDALSELDKLGYLPEGSEIAVRIKLSVAGGLYNFGEKFGAEPAQAVPLLKAVVARGLGPAITFHPGTQCLSPGAWESYIKAASKIAQDAGVRLQTLNVGGGFPGDRGAKPVDLKVIFNRIKAAKERYFSDHNPVLICEPGRGLVADAFALVLRVKNMRPNGAVVLNDGIYGALAEWRDMPPVHPRHITVFNPKGAERRGKPAPRVIFGPTCDSLDRLSDPLALPADIAEGDFVLIQGTGAYSAVLTSRFNGYGCAKQIFCTALKSTSRHFQVSG